MLELELNTHEKQVIENDDHFGKRNKPIKFDTLHKILRDKNKHNPQFVNEHRIDKKVAKDTHRLLTKHFLANMNSDDLKDWEDQFFNTKFPLEKPTANKTHEKVASLSRFKLALFVLGKFTNE